MNRYILILFLMINSIIIFPNVTEAHPGNTASDGKHYCWSNCNYWGETYGVRHGHGNYSGPESPTYKTKSSPYSSATYNLQKQLNSVIGSQLTTDGRRGTKTTQAIKVFQKKYGLVQDGIDNSVTKARLQELYDEYLQAQKNKEDKPLELKHINKGYIKDPEKFDACFNQKKSYKYCTDLVLEGRELDEVEIKKEEKNEEQGCFVAGTQILLPDGTTRNIEDIHPDEEILSSSGSLKVMKKYEINYKGLLYSINGSKLFVSDSHPFMTTEGWKSFDPEKTKIESPDLEVSQLHIGDILIKENGEQEILKEFYSEIRATTVYNFGLNGTKDFYADGYLVHNVDTGILVAVISAASNAKA